MVKIGTVWDSAVEAVRGRMGMIVPIAAGALFLPSAVQAAVQSYLVQPAAPSASAGTALIGSLVSFGALLLTLWGALAITGVTSHPDTTSGEAGRAATVRLLPLLGVYLILALVLVALALPFGVLLALAGVNPQALATPGYRPSVGGGVGLALALYALVVAGLFLWAFGRLLPLVPVVLHERLGLRSIGRAFGMTRGMGGKLVGLFILYIVVVGVATLAITSVVGLVFRLLLGADNAATAAFLGGVAGAVVGTALGVLSYAFVSRLYAFLSGRDLRAVFEDDPAP